jgi:hypothetical protein
VSHHGIECTEGFAGKPHVLGSTGHSQGHRHSANLGVGKSGLTEDAFKHPGIAKAKRPWLTRNRGWQLRAPADDGNRHSAPAISIGRRKDNDGDPTARSQNTAALA